MVTERTYHDPVTWLVAVDGVEHRVAYAPMSWRHWWIGRDLLVDGNPVNVRVRTRYQFPYGIVAEHEFAIGAHRCAIRKRQSRVMGTLETAIMVDGEVRETRRPADEREREARSNVVLVAVLLVALVAIVVLYGPSWIDAFNRAPL